MKRTISLLLLAASLTPKLIDAQIYVEPFIGYQKNLNSGKNNFLNTGIQFSYRLRKYEFLVQVQRAWPQSISSIDSSFTTNTSMPLFAPAQKTITASSFSVAIGNRFKIAGKRTKNSFLLDLFTGVMSQDYIVNYQYDKANYIILNPDKTIHTVGLFLSAGFVYMRQIKNNRFFAELNFSTPPSSNVKYPLSFNLIAPVTLNLGYSIKLSKK